ncbi:MAG: long-chain fatty acid--CoA ligase [Prolixibacteraceae bacterium]
MKPITEVTRTFDILDRYLSEFPRKDALGGKDNGEWYTFSTEEYVSSSRCFALGILAMGLQPGAKVATVTNNRPEWNFADMGLAMAGLVHVPIYPTIGNEEYRYILEHAEVQVLIVGDKKLYEKLYPVAKEIESIKEIYCFDKINACPGLQDILDLGRSKKAELSEELEKIKDSIHPDDVVTLIYTSGTTGVPKGVMLTHRNLVSNFVAHSQLHSLGKEHRTISFLPLCHVYERSMNYHFQYKGMGIYYVSNLGQIVAAIREIRPHMFNSVPRLMERVYDGFIAKGNEFGGLKKVIYFWAIRFTAHFDYNRKLNVFRKLQHRIADQLVYSKWREALGDNITYIVSGGAALQPRILKVFGMAGIKALEGYGLTETSPVIAVSNPLKNEMKIGTVGPVLPGVKVKIADDGEILCKGPSVMKGYYKDPELTAQVIDEEGWFHTGDIGILDEGKYLKITDRKKEMFKMSGGKYIAPQMIENKLKESFFIEQAMVIGENQKFASALISPNFEYLHNWCAERHILYRDNAELISKKEVLQQYQHEVEIINKTLGQHEEIKRFRLVVEEWSPQTGELSPTLKLKRNLLVRNYNRLIDEIYAVSKSDHPANNGIKLPRINLRVDLNELKRKLKW